MAGQEAWTEAEVTHSDPRQAALSRAILAPSSHNTQPWIIDLTTDNQIAIYVDSERLLPLADPLHRQTLLGHGAFLEQLDLSLRKHGHRTTVNCVTPERKARALASELPLMTVDLHRDRTEEDPLLEAVTERRTNKRAYEKQLVGTDSLETIRSATLRPGVELLWETATKRVQEIASLCRSAMAVETASAQRNAEVARWFRFDDDEIAEKRDGFGVAQSGTTGVAKWVAETFFLSRSSATDPEGTFAKKAVEMCWDQASTASAFGVLLSYGNTPEQQIEAGRAYVRAQLAATRIGVQSHPLSQLLQEYDDMSELHAQCRDYLNVPPEATVQMLFRVGYADPTPHSPRRAVAALLRR